MSKKIKEPWDSGKMYRFTLEYKIAQLEKENKRLKNNYSDLDEEYQELCERIDMID